MAARGQAARAVAGICWPSKRDGHPVLVLGGEVRPSLRPPLLHRRGSARSHRPSTPARPPDLPRAIDSGAGGGRVTAIRLPYRHLRDAETELVSLNGSPRAGAATPGEGSPKDQARRDNQVPRSGSGKTKLVLACMVAAGVQFGWALQLSLLTPYIQRTRDLDTVALLDNLPPLQQLLFRLLACQMDKFLVLISWLESLVLTREQRRRARCQMWSER